VVDKIGFLYININGNFLKRVCFQDHSTLLNRKGVFHYRATTHCKEPPDSVHRKPILGGAFFVEVFSWGGQGLKVDSGDTPQIDDFFG